MGENLNSPVNGELHLQFLTTVTSCKHYNKLLGSTGRLCDRILKIIWLIRQKGHTLLTSTCTVSIQTHGTADRPVASEHYDFSSILLQKIFERVLSSGI